MQYIGHPKMMKEWLNAPLQPPMIVVFFFVIVDHVLSWYLVYRLPDHHEGKTSRCRGVSRRPNQPPTKKGIARRLQRTGNFIVYLFR